MSLLRLVFRTCYHAPAEAEKYFLRINPPCLLFPVYLAYFLASYFALAFSISFLRFCGYDISKGGRIV